MVLGDIIENPALSVLLFFPLCPVLIASWLQSDATPSGIVSSLLEILFQVGKGKFDFSLIFINQNWDICSFV